MADKKTKPAKANQGKVLTILAIIIGAVLFLGGVGIVVVKLIDPDPVVDCCYLDSSVYPE